MDSSQYSIFCRARLNKKMSRPLLLRQKSSMARQAPQLRRKTSLMPSMFRSFRKETTKKHAFDTIGGVFTTESYDAIIDSVKSMNTVDTQSSEESTRSWNSSGSAEHHKGAPRIARRAISQRHINPDLPELELGDEEILGRIMLKSWRLPKNDGYYASNHVMINSERTKKYIPPLKRNRDMDEIAREQARLMAADNMLFHADPADLMDLFEKQVCRRIGENVTRGSNLHDIHQAMMDTVADRNNILDSRFTCMGIGTAKAVDGTLYLCQLFRD
jgi:hypothetical protein